MKRARFTEEQIIGILREKKAGAEAVVKAPRTDFKFRPIIGP